jgi:16S rRNA (cytidine1402-2'-O)-methyltransferase
MSLHRFNENRKIQTIVERLETGQSVALISDAGTPNISDPGYRLVRSVMEAGFRVVPIPGPSSVVAALSVSGIDGSSFVFLGFSPKKASALNDFFGHISHEEKTIVFLETARRIVKTMDVARKAIPSRRMVLCRELTKKFEEILSGNPESLYDKLDQRENIKGEFVVVIEPSGHRPSVDPDGVIEELIQAGLSGKNLAAEAHRRFGISRTLAYSKFLSMSIKDDSD